MATFNVMSNHGLYIHDGIINKCKAEEADAKLVRGVISEVKGGYQHIIARTVDNDMLILLLAYSYLLIQSGAISILVQSGVSHNFRLYDIVELQKEIGAKKCRVTIRPCFKWM